MTGVGGLLQRTLRMLWGDDDPVLRPLLVATGPRRRPPAAHARHDRLPGAELAGGRVASLPDEVVQAKGGHGGNQLGPHHH
jgi:hypothetical protein